MHLCSAALESACAAARAADPRECCGVLLGSAEQICAAIAVPNLAPQPERFVLDPLALLRVERAARARGERVWGYYHSHPSAAPAPSPLDLSGTLWPDCAPPYHLIVSGDGTWALYRVGAAAWVCVAAAKFAKA